MRKYGESKTTRILMATVRHVTSGSGLRKFQADGFLFDRVYLKKGSLTPINNVEVPAAIGCSVIHVSFTVSALILNSASRSCKTINRNLSNASP